MVESAAASARKAPGISDGSDQGNFHIIHAFFRDRFNTYFRNLQNAKYLIIEDSLVAVIKFLLSPLDQELNIQGFAQLQDHTVSLFLLYNLIKFSLL